MDPKYIPQSLDEAVDYLIDSAGPEQAEAVKKMTKEEFTFNTHGSLGRQIRNDWMLWYNQPDSPLTDHFTSIGINHGDDRSGIILDCVYQKINGLPYQIDKLVKRYQSHWLSNGKGELPPVPKVWIEPGSDDRMSLADAIENAKPATKEEAEKSKPTGIVPYLKSEQEQQIARMKALGMNTESCLFEQCVNALLFYLERGLDIRPDKVETPFKGWYKGVTRDFLTNCHEYHGIIETKNGRIALTFNQKSNNSHTFYYNSLAELTEAWQIASK
jgi:hypothetical protein